MADDSNPRRDPTSSMEPALAPSRQVPLDLVDIAAQIQHADQMLGTVTAGKLRMIADQIRHLQQSARAVLEQARQDASLHRATCLFRKRVGHVYHLYRTHGDAHYFSMLSPDDWKGSPPDVFEGSFRLEADMSWTSVRNMQGRDPGATSDRVIFGAVADNKP